MFNCPNCLPVVSNDVDFLILFKNESAFTKRRKNELNLWNFFLYLYALLQQQEITVFDWSVGLVGTINKKTPQKTKNAFH